MKDKIIERFVPGNGQEWIQNFNELIIKQVSEYSKNKIILDAGCGSGFTEKFLSFSAKRIDAYDISKEAINFAKKQFSYKNTNYYIKDFNKYIFKKNFYDLAISTEVVEHIKNYNFYIKNIFNSLKPQGIFVLSTPNKKFSSLKNKYHLKEFTYFEMKTLLKKNGFHLIKSTGIESNYISKIGTKYLNENIIALLKILPFYHLMIKLFCNFKKNNKNPKKSDTIIYVCKKI